MQIGYLIALVGAVTADGGTCGDFKAVYRANDCCGNPGHNIATVSTVSVTETPLVTSAIMGQIMSGATSFVKLPGDLFGASRPLSAGVAFLNQPFGGTMMFLNADGEPHTMVISTYLDIGTNAMKTVYGFITKFDAAERSICIIYPHATYQEDILLKFKYGLTKTTIQFTSDAYTSFFYPVKEYLEIKPTVPNFNMTRILIEAQITLPDGSSVSYWNMQMATAASLGCSTAGITVEPKPNAPFDPTAAPDYVIKYVPQFSAIKILGGAFCPAFTTYNIVDNARK
jgi:hypothetical protein